MTLVAISFRTIQEIEAEVCEREPLRTNENLLSRDAGLANGFANMGLVSVRLRTVDMAEKV